MHLLSRESEHIIYVWTIMLHCIRRRPIWKLTDNDDDDDYDLPRLGEIYGL